MWIFFWKKFVRSWKEKKKNLSGSKVFWKNIVIWAFTVGDTYSKGDEAWEKRKRLSLYFLILGKWVDVFGVGGLDWLNWIGFSRKNSCFSSFSVPFCLSPLFLFFSFLFFSFTHSFKQYKGYKLNAFLRKTFCVETSVENVSFSNKNMFIRKKLAFHEKWCILLFFFNFLNPLSIDSFKKWIDTILWVTSFKSCNYYIIFIKI